MGKQQTLKAGDLGLRWIAKGDEGAVIRSKNGLTEYARVYRTYGNFVVAGCGDDKVKVKARWYARIKAKSTLAVAEPILIARDTYDEAKEAALQVLAGVISWGKKAEKARVRTEVREKIQREKDNDARAYAEGRRTVVKVGGTFYDSSMATDTHVRVDLDKGGPLLLELDDAKKLLRGLVQALT